MHGFAKPFRCAALMALGALVLHELRFAVYSGDHVYEHAAEGRHGHIGIATVIVGVLIAAALGDFIRRLANARRERDPGLQQRVGALRVWLLASVGLLVLYLSQEAIEIVLASQEHVALPDLLGHGGWFAAPLAVAIGGIVALLFRAESAAMARAARAGRWHSARRRRERPWPVPAFFRRAADPLAESVGGRGPPLARSVAAFDGRDSGGA